MSEATKTVNLTTNFDTTDVSAFASMNTTGRNFSHISNNKKVKSNHVKIQEFLKEVRLEETNIDPLTVPNSRNHSGIGHNRDPPATAIQSPCIYTSILQNAPLSQNKNTLNIKQDKGLLSPPPHTKKSRKKIDFEYKPEIFSLNASSVLSKKFQSHNVSLTDIL